MVGYTQPTTAVQGSFQTACHPSIEDALNPLVAEAEIAVMDSTLALHPSDETLKAFVLAKLDDDSTQRVSDHLDSCGECLQRASELCSDDTCSAGFLDRLKAPRLSERAGAASTVAVEQRDAGLTTTAGLGDTPPPDLVNHPDYEIRRELGRGGMGVVYLAYNRLMGRNEVLKFMGRHIIERPGVMDRFLREIRAVAQLRHSNIVTAYQAFRSGESFVFAMEYVEGMDLAKMVKARGPMPVAHACHFIQQAAHGLDHAHEHGMVHRDIKPNNLMLSRNRDKALIKVLDFGLAKASLENERSSGLEGPDGQPLWDRSLTLHGEMLGTPDFIAPEQIGNAKGADIRADIYSLGCTLYYLLSGRPPFHAETLYDILQAHFSMEARLLDLVRAEVPTDLAALVAKMMAKDPDRRFQTPDEVARALTPFHKGTSKTAVAPGLGISRTDAPAASLGAVGPTQVAPASPPAPAPAAPTVAERKQDRPEEMWRSLIDINEDEDFQPAPALATQPVGKRPRWFWPAVAGLLGFAALLLGAGVIYRISTDKGELVIETEDPNIDVVVKQGGKQVTIIDTETKNRVELKAGNYELELSSGKPGAALQLSTDSFTLKRGDKTVVSVRRIRPAKTPISVPRSTDTIAERTDQKAAVDPVLADSEKEHMDRGKEVVSPAPPVQAATASSVWNGWSKDDPPPAIAPFDAPRAKAHQRAWARHLGLPVEYTNSIGMKFVLIPAGTFTMGSTPAEIEEALRVERNNEGWGERITSESPQHQVILTRPIYLGMHEVRQKDYESIMGENPSCFARTGTDARLLERVAGLDTTSYPVDNVSWNKAAEFCARLSQKEALRPFYSREGEPVTQLEGTGYRLPTEAEWEYACRAGTTTKFWSGNREEDLAQVGWYVENSGHRTHAVGELPSNPFGLFDMHGNAFEWVEDWWDPTYYAQFVEKPAINPCCPSSSSSLRLNRGGDFNNYSVNNRSSTRYTQNPAGHWYIDGFRVSLTVEAVKQAVTSHDTSKSSKPNGRATRSSRQVGRGSQELRGAERGKPEGSR